MNKTVNERIASLQKRMKEEHIDIYLVPTSDYHQSEYVGNYFRARQYLTGFTGSAGTAVVTQDECYLWTDGRYFIQAENELKGSVCKLMKDGQPGVPTIKEFLEEHLPKHCVLGFDGRTISMQTGIDYMHMVDRKHGRVRSEVDLINDIWVNRPARSMDPAYALPLKYAGETTESKLARIREYMKSCGADYHMVSTLDDICWILNMRGTDVKYFPLVLCYAVITMYDMKLYIDKEKLNEELLENFRKAGVILHPYDEVIEDTKMIPSWSRILIDPNVTSFSVYRSIPQDAVRIERQNPEILFKAIKNETEIANIRVAQIKDSVAHVRFIKWLKENAGKMEINELQAADKLDEFRVQMGNFISPSFGPISAYGPNAAMNHYSPSAETAASVVPGGMLLTDTGGGYWEGTTDITRTYAIGEIPQEQKEHFTLVTICNLSLANAKFRKGSTGVTLDILARKPLWDRNLDYNHGTGHGVGYLLSVHEGPANFRWRSRGQDAELAAGMIITNEPGLYFDYSHGIRLENEVLVCEGETNYFGTFMYLETITYIPFDLDAIIPEMMSESEKKLLNDYHALVFEKIAPYLNEEEKEWLAFNTRAI